MSGSYSIKINISGIETPIKDKQVIFLFLKKINVYLFLREREKETERGGEGQREREAQNPKQAPGSELSVQSPKRVSEHTNRKIMT